MINDALKSVAVIGAGGKMGSGISLLLLQEMARLEAELMGKTGQGQYRLMLVDADPEALKGLYFYLHMQLPRYAEKNIIALRNYYIDDEELISNEEIIRSFCEGAMGNVRMETELTSASQAILIFEAISENIESKVNLFKTLGSKSYFFTNTSSIPIHVLNDLAHLDHRIIGFHFYNPPAIQKLVELIVAEKIDPQLVTLAETLAKRLGKQIVRSDDLAGFIGNGHFLREILFACKKVHDLSREYTLFEAIYIINKVTQDFLIRPMGIFQLIDYIGIDICHSIAEIMDHYLPDELFQDPLLDFMIAEDIRGGQNRDSTQKNGFFTYEGHHLKLVYSPEDHQYVALPWNSLDKALGSFPEGHASWKHLQNDPEGEIKIRNYLQQLSQSNSLGASLAQGFLQNSQSIAEQLIKMGAASNLDDVDTVLKLGFFHLYGISTVTEAFLNRR